MKHLVQNHLLAVFLVAPCAALLVAMELLHVVPGRSARVTFIRWIVWVLSALALVALAVLVVARFVELRVK